MVCNSCQYVLAEGQLVDGFGYGIVETPQNWVHADDDGRTLGRVRLEGGPGVGKYTAQQRKVQDFRKRVEKLATALGVDRSIQQETHALVEQVLDSWSSGSRMPRAALLAAACVFIVSRLHGLPLTIVNIALEAQVSPFSLGCAVSALARERELRVPSTPVPELIHRFVCALPQLTAIQDTVAGAAVQLYWWSEERGLEGSTVTKASAAVAIAAEASQVRVDAKQLAREAQFSEGAVRRIEGKLRQLLVDAAAPLPWSPSITAANVGQHLRLIMKLELASNME